LKMSLQNIEDLNCLGSMPKLEFISFMISGTHLIRELCEAPIFPRSLKRLSLLAFASSKDWTPCLMHLGDLIHLHTLLVTIGRRSATPTSNALHKCYPLLPSSLTRLTIPLLENLPYTAFSQLPRSLRYLNVESLAPDSVVGNSYFAHVPCSITHLTAQCSEVDENVYKVIPPTILDVFIPARTGNPVAAALYYSNSVWQGCEM
jgi:hypothetical protein